MKKLMFAAAAIAASVAVADVTSANIVGYQKVTLPAGQDYAIVGIPFDAVGSTEGINIQDLFPNPLDTFEGGTGASSVYADVLMFWVDGDYMSLYCRNATNPTSRYGKWINPAGCPASWGTQGAPSQLKVKPGDSFWVHRKDGTWADKEKDLTIAGQVVVGQSGTYDLAIGAEYTLCAFPFTAPFKLNDDSRGTDYWFNKGVEGGTGASSVYADVLMFWVDGDYMSLYCRNATNPTSRYGKWINPAGCPSSWGTQGAPTVLEVQPGEGFWYHRKDNAGAFTLSFDKPYSL